MKILALFLFIFIASFACGQEPTKHPFQQCLDTYQSCMQSAEDSDAQIKCFLGHYECQNIYTRKCRKLYRNVACYEILGKDECWRKLRECYGNKPE